MLLLSRLLKFISWMGVHASAKANRPRYENLQPLCLDILPKLLKNMSKYGCWDISITSQSSLLTHLRDERDVMSLYFPLLLIIIIILLCWVVSGCQPVGSGLVAPNHAQGVRSDYKQNHHSALFCVMDVKRTPVAASCRVVRKHV